VKKGSSTAACEKVAEGPRKESIVGKTEVAGDQGAEKGGDVFLSWLRELEETWVGGTG